MSDYKASFTQGDYQYIVGDLEVTKSGEVEYNHVAILTLSDNYNPCYQMVLTASYMAADEHYTTIYLTPGTSSTQNLFSVNGTTARIEYNGQRRFTLYNYLVPEDAGVSVYYTLYAIDNSNTNVAVKVVDISKTSYSAIPSTVTYNVPSADGTITQQFTVTSLKNCFSNSNIVNPPVIPETVTEMDYCFYNCTSLKLDDLFIIPASVTSMSYCFKGCTTTINSWTIIVYNNPTFVDYLFDDTTITITLITTSEGYETWKGVDDYYANVLISPVYFVAGDYVYQILTGVEDNQVAPNVVDRTKISYSTIPETVTYNNIVYTITSLKGEFNGYAGTFNRCENMVTAPNLPDTILNIDTAFQDCTLLKYVNVPPYIETMDDAFNGCTALEVMPTLPNTVFYMQWAFANCTSLTTVQRIPLSVYLVNYCFYGCTSLTGQINIYGAPTYNNMTGIFQGTVEDIQLFCWFDDSAALNAWRSVTGDYNNVSMPTDPINNLEVGDYKYIIVNRGIEKTEANNIDANSYTLVLNTAPPSSGLELTFEYVISSTPPSGGMVSIMPIGDTGTEYFTSGMPKTVTLSECTVAYDGNDTFEITGIANSFDKNSFKVTYNYGFDGYKVRVLDTTKTSYEAPLTAIKYNGETFEVNSLAGCFSGCTSLTQAIDIPANITDISSCFYGCTALVGKIRVYNVPTKTENAFSNPYSNVYIMNGITEEPDRTAVKMAWEPIAAEYTNVHYEANDSLKPTITQVEVRRVSDMESREAIPEQGEAYYVIITGTYSNTFVPNADNDIDKEQTQFILDDAVPAVIKFDEDTYIHNNGSFVMAFWLKNTSISKAILKTIVGDKYKLSEELRTTIAGVQVLVDYYHNIKDGEVKEGVVFGRYANNNDLGTMTVALPSSFENVINLGRWKIDHVNVEGHLNLSYEDEN